MSSSSRLKYLVRIEAATSGPSTLPSPAASPPLGNFPPPAAAAVPQEVPVPPPAVQQAGQTGQTSWAATAFTSLFATPPAPAPVVPFEGVVGIEARNPNVYNKAVDLVEAVFSGSVKAQRVGSDIRVKQGDVRALIDDYVRRLQVRFTREKKKMKTLNPACKAEVAIKAVLEVVQNMSPALCEHLAITAYQSFDPINLPYIKVNRDANARKLLTY